jgi:DNA polymerase sigma
MAKEEIEEGFEDLSSDDETLESEEQKPKRKEIKTFQKPQAARQQRYKSVHQAQADGVIDTIENKFIATEIWDMLASLKNDLEEIKRAVGN